MVRTVVTVCLLFVGACGGKAIDDPNYDGPKGGGGDTKSSGGSHSTPAEPSTEKTCGELCSEWQACTPDADGDKCSRDCIKNYNEASAIGCGKEYDALLNCYANRGACSGNLSGCDVETTRYVECYD